MPNPDYDVRATPSVFDRLIDETPTEPLDPPIVRAESVRRFRRAVLRDLEELLNSRNPLYDLAPEFAEVGQSAAAYGLPDLTSLSASSPTDLARLRQQVERVIRVFEPRLLQPTVTLQTAPGRDRQLRMHVEAQLAVDPTPEPLAFDIVVPMPSRRCEVQEVG